MKEHRTTTTVRRSIKDSQVVMEDVKDGTATKIDARAQRQWKESTTFPAVSIDDKTAKVLWRDALFVVLGGLALSLVGFVETHATDVGDNDRGADSRTIVDTGFILTKPLFDVLSHNVPLNDFLAFLNSLTLLIPVVYVVYTTLWVGDYSLSFRVIATQLLRSFCGWFTYLPPDPSFLPSYYDFPDCFMCLFEDCSGAPKVMPFVSFFSGHVAILVIAANHMWLRNYRSLSIVVHTLNAFQIVRLLSTRGHYSIDIIIGWYVAIYVSTPAARLGRYYSRGKFLLVMPKTPEEAFESVTGVADLRMERRFSKLLRRSDVQEYLKNLGEEDEESEGETTAKFIVTAYQTELAKKRE